MRRSITAARSVHELASVEAQVVLVLVLSGASVVVLTVYVAALAT